MIILRDYHFVIYHDVSINCDIFLTMTMLKKGSNKKPKQTVETHGWMALLNKIEVGPSNQSTVSTLLNWKCCVVNGDVS